MIDADCGPGLPSFSFVFDRSAWRLEGLRGWDDLLVVGRGNLERLLALARERATDAHHRELFDRGERRDMEQALAHLDSLAGSVSESRPILPRLRVEHFRVGDAIAIFLGDSPSAVAGEPWAKARVTSIDKAHNPAWVTSEPNSGYYWQVTAEASRELLPGARQLRFSTSEPRALLEPELGQLHGEVEQGSRFASVWCENARRPWTPIWCLERGESIDPDQVDLGRWLRQAR